VYDEASDEEEGSAYTPMDYVEEDEMETEKGNEKGKEKEKRDTEEEEKHQHKHKAAAAALPKSKSAKLIVLHPIFHCSRSPPSSTPSLLPSFSFMSSHQCSKRSKVGFACPFNALFFLGRLWFYLELQISKVALFYRPTYQMDEITKTRR